MKLEIKNIVKYQFSNPVSYGIQRLRLIPHEAPGQRIVNWNIDYVGAKAQAQYVDHHDNHCTLITFLPDVTEVIIHVNGIVKTHQKKVKYISKKHITCPIWVYKNETNFTTAGRSILNFCRIWYGSSLSKIDLCWQVAEAIKNEMQYQRGETNVLTTAEQAFQKKQGVCQDFTHIFVTCLRHLNFPARYVSGYLKMNGIKIQNATHAWAEVFIDNSGWLGFDLVNDIAVDEKYVKLATGCDYRDATPINGLQFDSQNNIVENQIEVRTQKNRKVDQ